MKTLIAVLCSLCLTTSVIAGVIDDAVKRGTLRVGLNPTYMPFEMTTKQGEVIGFEVDVLKAMTKAMGVKLELVSMPFDGLIPSLLTEKFDLIASGMTISQQRNIKVNFTNPLIMNGQTVLIRKELKDKVKSYKDLNSADYKITSRIGTTGEATVNKLLSKAQYFSYNTEAEALLEVANGKADAFVYDSSYNVLALEKLGRDQLILISEPITYEPQAFALRKGDYDSINWINNFFNQIKNDGTYDRLYNKWFKKTNWLEQME